MEMRVGESVSAGGRAGGRGLPAQPLEARKAGDDNEEDASSERARRTDEHVHTNRTHTLYQHARARAREVGGSVWSVANRPRGRRGGPSDCARRTRRCGAPFLCKYSRLPTMLKKVLREISTNVQLTTQETAIPNTAPPTLDSARRAFSPIAMLRFGPAVCFSNGF